MPAMGTRISRATREHQKNTGENMEILIGISIGLPIGLPIGAIAYIIGNFIAESYRRKHGCYTVCQHCGKPPFD
jgi:hypothetical protein